MSRRKKNLLRSASKGEWNTLVGLATLGIGSIALLSIFINVPLFLFIKNFFFDSIANFFFAICMFNITLSLFKVKTPFTNLKSLVGQAVFVVFYAAFLNSIWGNNYKIVSGLPVKYGGLVGLYVYNFFSQYLTLQYTPIFIFIIIFLCIPFILSMTVTRFLEIIGSVMEKFYNFFKKILSRNTDNNLLASTPVDEPAQTFGQLQRKASVEVLGKASTFTQNISSDDNQDDKNEQITGQNEGNEYQTVSGMSQKNKDLRAQGINMAKSSGDDKPGAYVNEELKYPNWKNPSINLLNSFKKKKPSQENINKNADIIEHTLKSFGIKATVEEVLIGPAVTQYALDIALGTKVSKITNLINNLALALATQSNSVRLETPIPGTTYIGIEVPNEERETIYLKEAMQELNKVKDKYLLPLVIGKDIHGNMIIIDLQKMPHILIAGATGSGKSILTNGLITSLLMTRTPDQVKFIMVDPKQVELSDYNGIPYLLTPVVTDMDKVLNALKWAIYEMESRYTIFRESKVKNIESYNKLMGYPALPYFVIVIDEMADMMMSTNRVETENAIVRLAQKARATGIHLILSTQRPSVDVITGLIKANIPGRIGMSVTTNIDSRVILDQIGAESLLGGGDMLFKDPAKNKPFRIQGIWVSPDEVQNIVKFIKEQGPEVEYTTKVTEFKVKEEGVKENTDQSDADELFASAVKLVVNAQKGSTSYLQRKLSIGYNRAARILDELEEMGVVGPGNGGKPRNVLISDADAFLSSLNTPPETSKLAQEAEAEMESTNP